MVALLTATLIITVFATAARAAQPNLKNRTARTIVATWTCQRQLEVPATPLPHRLSPWFPHSVAFRSVQLNRWQNRWRRCTYRLHARADALRTGRYDTLPTDDLYALADQAIRHGAIYSVRWGDASPILKGVCYEAVRRAFAPYRTQEWARFVVNRESGCNPGAVNTTYSVWREQAQCIAQMIPKYHTWIDYSRCKSDLRYAVRVFVGLSNGGKSTGPWG